MRPPLEPSLLLQTQEAAKLLGISRKQLRVWVIEDRAPPRLRIGKRYYWSREMLTQWVKALSLAA